GAASPPTSSSSGVTQGLVHDYELNGSYADSFGGPALVPNGGTLGTTGYSFGAHEGLRLRWALTNPRNYSIEMVFNISNISSYRRLIEFKNLQADTGLYDFNGSLQFYNTATGPSNAITPNVNVDLLLTRDAATKEVIGYINGVEQFSFTDGG